MPKTIKLRAMAILFSSVIFFSGCFHEEPVLVNDKEEVTYREVSRVTVKSNPTRAESLWTSVYESSDGFDTTVYFDFMIEACAA